ncbi:hypothetical protein MMC07_006626, partial [Pseudocyphellaria aurata]|nr:hypothetical protein [Pseudocyphellaria aurata]
NGPTKTRELTHEVERPIGRCRERVRRSPDPKRHNLGGIQPSHAKPADGEKGVEEEEEQRGDDAGAFGPDFGHDRQDYLSPSVRGHEANRTTSEIHADH